MRIIRCALIFFILSFAACKEESAPSSTHQQKRVAPSPKVAAGEVGSQLPSFSTPNLQGGTISSADLKGKVAIIDFWAPWCQPCAKEMPGYQTLLDRYGENELAVIGFKTDMKMPGDEDALQFARRLGVRYPIAIGTDEIQKQFGGLVGLPTTLIYDRSGILRSKVIGFESVEQFESTIKPLLAGKY